MQEPMSDAEVLQWLDEDEAYNLRVVPMPDNLPWSNAVRAHLRSLAETRKALADVLDCISETRGKDATEAVAHGKVLVLRPKKQGGEP